MTGTLTIGARFNGPEKSANGGYTCGRVAGLAGGGPNAVVEVTLRAPPPLETPMDVVRDGAALSVLHDGSVIAAARLDATVLQVPARVPFEAAAEVANPNDPHPFPKCFVCGPDRGDGLRLFTGAPSDADVAAAAWVPDDSLAGDDGMIRPEFLFAALDCPSGWSYDVLGVPFRGNETVPVLLGRMTAQLFGSVRTGENCVVVAQPAGGGGRKWYAISAVYGGDGRLRAVARTVWITLS